MISARIGPCCSTMGRTRARTAASTAASDQSDLATKWCSDWYAARTRPGRTRVAIGSTLLRSPGSSNPAQYDRKGAAKIDRKEAASPTEWSTSAGVCGTAR